MIRIVCAFAGILKMRTKYDAVRASGPLASPLILTCAPSRVGRAVYVDYSYSTDDDVDVSWANSADSRYRADEGSRFRKGFQKVFKQCGVCSVFYLSILIARVLHLFSRDNRYHDALNWLSCAIFAPNCGYGYHTTCMHAASSIYAKICHACKLSWSL